MTPRSNYRLPRIPEMTIRRLSVYTRCLLQLEEDGVKTVSSQELADRFNLNSAQVRKDLAYFGEFGVRGIGYYVSGLKAERQRMLGLDRGWAVALMGFGNLGSALGDDGGFARAGLRIAAIHGEAPSAAVREGEPPPGAWLPPPRRRPRVRPPPPPPPAPPRRPFPLRPTPARRRRPQAHRARRSPSSLERVAPRSCQAEFEPIRERALEPVGADRRRFRCPKPRVTGPRHGRRTGG